MKREDMSLQDQANAAMKKAIRNVIKQHKLTGRPLSVWRNGKTVLISPDTIK